MMADWIGFPVEAEICAQAPFVFADDDSSLPQSAVFAP